MAGGAVLYWDLFIQSYKNYAAYLWGELLHPHWHNYFFWLVAISLAVFGLELAFPWRKNQPVLRRDFWLDAFYMLFNFFLFSLIGFAAVSELGVRLFRDLLAGVGVSHPVAVAIGSWPGWLQLLVLFVLRDFIHYWIHRLLHRVPWLWECHKLHHSVLEMGFAAHLRYHWMENVVYRGLEYLPLAMIGFGIDDFLLVHLTALTIGHLNHANLRLPLGPLRYLFNNPQMHIWHHVAALPNQHPHGLNFGISLSVWDYVFKTAYQPRSGRDLALGFPEVETFPRGFLAQTVYPFLPAKKSTPFS